MQKRVSRYRPMWRLSESFAVQRERKDSALISPSLSASLLCRIAAAEEAALRFLISLRCPARNSPERTSGSVKQTDASALTASSQQQSATGSPGLLQISAPRFLQLPRT